MDVKGKKDEIPSKADFGLHGHVLTGFTMCTRQGWVWASYLSLGFGVVSGT
jgi:hypothetical protein